MFSGEVLAMSQGEGEGKTSVPDSRTSSSNTHITCGCSSCTADVLQRKISRNEHEWAIGDQIKWVIKNFDYTETEACLLLCDELYSDVCSECSPSYCN